MKIGLLACDHIQEGFPDYPDLFKNLLNKFQFEVFNICENDFPSSVSLCDAWLITGSKYSVYDDIDWIVKLKSFVREIAVFSKPCLGVCFGHQMLGEAMGGKVMKSERGWCVGVHEFDMVENEAWMTPFQPKINLLMSCQDQIVTLPPNSKVLAKAELCPVGMIKIGDNMLGIQGHPEFSKDYVSFLMQDRTNRIGDEVVRKGLESLSLTTHDLIVGMWINSFLAK